MSDHPVIQLTPQQESFVATVLAAKPPVCHILNAPVGTGKTTTLIETVGRLARGNPSLRVLVLCPAIFTQQFAALAAMSSNTLKIAAVDRQRYRELEAAASIKGSPFEPGTLALLSIDLAKHSDVMRGLLSTHWDLMAVDEAHALAGQRGNLVQQLIDSGMVDRSILMSASPVESLKIPGALVTQWKVDEKVLPTALAALWRCRSVTVTYTNAEIAVFDVAEKLAEELTKNGSPQLSGVIRTRIYSSLYSLERCLRNLRNEAAHEHPSSTDGAVNGTDQSETAHTPPWLQDRAEQVLSAMDEVAIDSKIDALCSLLGSQPEPPGVVSAVVVSQFASTVEYLTAALSNRGMVTRALTAQLAPKDLAVLVDQMATPGITVASFAALGGLELPPAGLWIFYEKVGANAIGLRLARSPEQTAPTNIAMFQFETPTLDLGSPHSDEHVAHF
jgi:hypothetical protein